MTQFSTHVKIKTIYNGLTEHISNIIKYEGSCCIYERPKGSWNGCIKIHSTQKKLETGRLLTFYPRVTENQT